MRSRSSPPRVRERPWPTTRGSSSSSTPRSAPSSGPRATPASSSARSRISARTPGWRSTTGSSCGSTASTTRSPLTSATLPRRRWPTGQNGAPRRPSPPSRGARSSWQVDRSPSRCAVTPRRRGDAPPELAPLRGAGDRGRRRRPGHEGARHGCPAAGRIAADRRRPAPDRVQPEQRGLVRSVQGQRGDVRGRVARGDRADRRLPRADRREHLHDGDARPPARWRDREHARPAPARVRRRFRRRWNRQGPVVHVQRGRRGDQPGDPPPARRRAPAIAGRATAGRTGGGADAAGLAGARAMTGPGTHSLQVPPDAIAQRVDRYVADVTGLSRSHVQKLISAGNLTTEGIPLKANAVIGPGTALRLVVPEPELLDMAPAPEIPVRIVYEDADLLIVDKPAGLVVHPSPGHGSGTLVNALLALDAGSFGGIAGVQRPGIVHRLDRDTSGLLMVARTDAAQHSLMAQLKARRVKKTYLALVLGEVSAEVGRIEAPIGRDPKHRTR